MKNSIPTRTYSVPTLPRFNQEWLETQKREQQDRIESWADWLTVHLGMATVEKNEKTKFLLFNFYYEIISLDVHVFACEQQRGGNHRTYI